MSSNIECTHEASDLEAPTISISEPKSVYVSREAALSYVQKEFQAVEDLRKTSFATMEETFKKSAEEAENYRATLDHYQRSQRRHEMAENVLFAGALAALTGFFAYGGLRVVRWVLEKLKRTSGKTNLTDQDSKMEEEEEMSRDGFASIPRRLHMREWVTGD